MMKKLTLLAGLGVGYVLGARAGRERYEQIRSQAQKLSANPKVRSATSKAQDTVTTQAGAAASAVADKVGDTVGSSGSGSGSGSSGSGGPGSTGPGPAYPSAVGSD